MKMWKKSFTVEFYLSFSTILHSFLLEAGYKQGTTQ
jgi:hypothetical protein